MRDCVKAKELCKKHEDLYYTVGVHPTRCSEFSDADADDYFNNLKKILVDDTEKKVNN